MLRLLEVIFKRLRHGDLAIVIAASLALVFIGLPLVEASKKMRPLTHSEVSRIWVGISEDELYMLRLSLAADGRGSGAYAFLDDEPHFFRISSWEYAPPRLRIRFEPTDQSELVMNQLSGNIVGMRINLRMSGKGWSRLVSLRREEDLLARWTRLKEAMPRHELKE